MAKKKKTPPGPPSRIQGYIGERRGEIATLQTSVKPKRYAAIERFEIGKNAEGRPVYQYIETPFEPKKTCGLEGLNAYLTANRRMSGSYSTAEQYHAGLKNTKSGKGSGPTPRTARELHEYSSDISGNIGHKTPKALARIIRMAEASNADFFADLIPQKKEKPARRQAKG